MSEEKQKKKKHIFVFLRIAVVVAAIVWGVVLVNRDVGWGNLGKIFLRIDLGIFAVAMVIFVVGQMIVGLRWWLLLRTQSIFINFWVAVRLFFMGWFYNNFMPGALGGDLIRAWYVTKHTHKRFEAALSVFVDRLVGLLSTLTIATFFYFIFMVSEGNRITFVGKGGFIKWVSEHRGVFIWIIAAGLVVLCIISTSKKGRRKLKALAFNIWIRGVRLFLKLRDAIVLYFRKPLGILMVFVLTVLMQLMVITSFVFLGKNLGIEASAKYYYVFFTLTWVLGAVPVSIGGAGVVEGLLFFMFTEFAGVADGLALALALCQRLIWMLTSLPGAAIHLFGAHLPKEFSIDYEGPIN